MFSFVALAAAHAINCLTTPPYDDRIPPPPTSACVSKLIFAAV